MMVWLCVSATTSPGGMIFGSGEVTVANNEDYKCQVFRFTAPFASGDVKIQMTIASEKYTASVPWAEDVKTSG